MSIDVADGIEWLLKQPEKSLDLCLGSPPYEDCRSYGGIPSRRGQEWVDWMVEVTRAATRACKGLVAWVVVCLCEYARKETA